MLPTVEAAWSDISAPSSHSFIPQSVPAAPNITSQSGDAEADLGLRNVELELSSAEDLNPTSLGQWSVNVVRLLPDGSSEADRVQGLTGTDWRVFASPEEPSRLLPYGTRVQIFLTDPVGRDGLVTELALEQ